MTVADFDAILGQLGLSLARVRDDLAITGSPDRAIERAAIEDVDGGLWIVEKHDPCLAARKQAIAAAEAYFSRHLPEVRSSLSFAPGRYVAELGGAAWLVRPFVESVTLDRPGFAFESWRGEALAGLLVRFRRAALDWPVAREPQALSLAGFVRDLAGKLRARERPLFEAVTPAVHWLEGDIFPRLDGVPTVFSHGDFHPLNVLWSRTGINGLIDFEFCGLRPETYDAALLVGCVGMEDPRSLAGDLILRLVGRLRAEAGYSAAGWETFAGLVLALRFAWLSDWLRRDDREMVDLESDYITLLLEGREDWKKAWT